MRRLSTAAIAAILAALAVASSAAAAGADGSLGVLPGASGCLMSTGRVGLSNCPVSTAVGLFDASSLAISPDGRFAYVASVFAADGVHTVKGGTVTAYSRDPA